MYSELSQRHSGGGVLTQYSREGPRLSCSFNPSCAFPAYACVWARVRRWDRMLIVVVVFVLELGMESGKGLWENLQTRL